MKLLENKKYHNHSWAQKGYVCEVPVELLDKIRYKDATDYTDMPSGDIKHQNLIFDSIEKDGMQDPLLIVISPEKQTMRLESGNHRIKVAKSRGYSHLPCAFVLYDVGFFHLRNGDHLYELDTAIFDIENIDVEKATYPIYINPKEIVKDNSFIFFS